MAGERAVACRLAAPSGEIALGAPGSPPRERGERERGPALGPRNADEGRSGLALFREGERFSCSPLAGRKVMLAGRARRNPVTQASGFLRLSPSKRAAPAIL